MTETMPRPARRSALDRWRTHGGHLAVLRVCPGGLVQIIDLHATAVRLDYGVTELWPTAAVVHNLGAVDVDRPAAYADAADLADAAGWIVVGDWTTVDRYPIARVRRARLLPAGTVPAGD